jgi:hypothetical protein
LRDTELGRVYGRLKVGTFEGLQVGMLRTKRLKGKREGKHFENAERGEYALLPPLFL